MKEICVLHIDKQKKTLSPLSLLLPAPFFCHSVIGAAFNYKPNTDKKIC